MYEKMSEKEIREEKVHNLKAKLVREIRSAMDSEFTKLNNLKNKPKRVSVMKLHTLYRLLDFVTSDNAFMEVRAEFDEADAVLYTLDSVGIDCMLEEEHLLDNILSTCEGLTDGTFEGAESVEFNDLFFQYDVYSIVDRVVLAKGRDVLG